MLLNVQTRNSDIHAFSKYPPETSACIQRENSWDFSRVHFVCSDPCARLGEVDVWDSFSVNNTCWIALNLSAHRVCKLYLVITCRAKGQITNVSRLQAYDQVASEQADVMRQKLQPLVEPPWKDTLDTVSTPTRLTYTVPHPSLAAHYV